MEAENQNTFTSCCASQSSSSSSSPDAPPPENHADSLTHHSPTVGTVIPNRIFVGGMGSSVNDGDLRCVFSQHGAIKEVKIVTNRFGMSKGYGFVTFETQEDALNVLRNANGICCKDKMLLIGQAVRKHQTSGRTKSASTASSEPATPQQMCLTTSTPYTYHNGVAYFHCPNMSPPAHHWPPARQLMLPQSHQPVYQPAAHQHYQCVPNQYQWNAVQLAMPSSAAVFSQQSDYVYQPADGGSIQPSVAVMEDGAPEFVEPTVQHVYPLYAPRAEGMTPIVLQRDPVKNLMFPPSRVHLKPKYCRYKDLYYVPESTEPPDVSTFQPVM
ncbi:protein boule-like [Stegastes partitus]|uniref:Protein boule-like n=1 Tax=Stegastes partitus TaxID=144197 RepID=A0A9Y4NK50_9TELE|nr:PREDICTED: protein boule-like [Stegastes partitus]